jgi:hypothetical protein
MADDREAKPERRTFLRMVPACALTCLALHNLPLCAEAPAAGQNAPAGQAPHKFDQEVPRKPTFRQMFRQGFGGTIMFGLFLERTLGKEKTIELMKQFSVERAEGDAKAAAKEAGGNDFATLKRMFSPDSPDFRNYLTMQIVESSDKVHQLKVTECLYAATFRQANAGHLGYAGVCHGDYTFARAFNPQVVMERDKTLMQGDAFCNHRYLLKG